jgi:TonB-dependent SusC/RagA subfamily outer membrane receptor
VKKLLSILAGLFLLTVLNAQVKTVMGKVTTLEEIPVQDALIVVKSNKQIIHSDSMGYFSVECLANDKLTISAKGFNKYTIKIKPKTKYAFVNLNLVSKDQVRYIPIGYGYVTPKNNLYAMSSQNDNNFDFSTYRSIYDILIANFPGLQIINNAIIIRGTQAFGRNPTALMIVDGREVTRGYFSNIAPSDIAQINVLKDASAAVYGSRGANGVVIVVTKRGPQR